jgi:hypothetical protein
MNPNLVLEIMELATSLVKSMASKDFQPELATEETLIELAQRTAQAYEEHTGEPLDPSAIRNADPLPLIPRSSNSAM